MTKELAFQLINCELYEDYNEAWEMYFFQLKQELLQMPFASRLISLKLKKIQQAKDIQKILYPKSNNKQSLPQETPQGKRTISEILENQSALKLKIHTTQSPEQLEQLLIEYDFLAVEYEHYIYSKLSSFDQPNQEVPYKNVADIMEIIKELEELDKLKTAEKKNLGKFEEKFPGLWHEFQRVKNHINQELIA